MKFYIVFKKKEILSHMTALMETVDTILMEVTQTHKDKSKKVNHTESDRGREGCGGEERMAKEMALISKYKVSVSQELYVLMTTVSNVHL
jgi:hypothetical protein